MVLAQSVVKSQGHSENARVHNDDDRYCNTNNNQYSSFEAHINVIDSKRGPIVVNFENFDGELSDILNEMSVQTFVTTRTDPGKPPAVCRNSSQQSYCFSYQQTFD